MPLILRSKNSVTILPGLAAGLITTRVRTRVARHKPYSQIYRPAGGAVRRHRGHYVGIVNPPAIQSVGSSQGSQPRGYGLRLRAQHRPGHEGADVCKASAVLMPSPLTSTGRVAPTYSRMICPLSARVESASLVSTTGSLLVGAVCRRVARAGGAGQGRFLEMRGLGGSEEEHTRRYHEVKIGVPVAPCEDGGQRAGQAVEGHVIRGSAARGTCWSWAASSWARPDGMV